MVQSQRLTVRWKAALDIDFVNGKAWLGSTETSLSGLFTVTRASTGTYENSDGSITTFGPNTLRYGDKGLLVEEERTNYLKNSDMEGATVGTLPTGWG